MQYGSNVVSNSTTLYCDYRKVKINNNLKTETQKEYMANITKTEIKNVEKNVTNVNKEIQNNKNLIDLANKKIDDLNGQYKYEIEQEQTITTEKISNYKSKIQQITQQNEDLKNTKSLMAEKIKKLQQQLKDITKK